MSSRFRSLCVFCGSHPGSHPAYLEAARETGKFFAENEISLVYGGGSVGMMGAVADACLEAGGEVIGVIPSYLVDRELAHPDATRMEVVETLIERKRRMADLSDGFLSLPGGIGTLDELFEMLTWARLREHDKPSGLLNVEGFFDELISFCRKTQVEGGFISEVDASNLVYGDKLPEVIQHLERAAESGPSSLYRT